MHYTLILFALLALLPNAVSANKATPQVGYFIDAPVTGLYYYTSSGLSGVTDKGGFSYREGDTVDFFLGNRQEGILLASTSAKPVITPLQISTQTTHSVNLTRLLMSLDNQPKERDHIVVDTSTSVLEPWLDTLRNVDFSYLDQALLPLAKELVSGQEALAHLVNSQQYIQERFTSPKVIFEPFDQPMTEVMIRQKDIEGNICTFNLDFRHRRPFSPPIAVQEFTVRSDRVTVKSSTGDRFSHCHLQPQPATTQHIDVNELKGVPGVIGCALQGCTHNDLNGFSIEDRQDDDDWNYRTFAMSFDPQTQISMQKIQGLGAHPKLAHDNQEQTIRFVYPTAKAQRIRYQGIWRENHYANHQNSERCLRITDTRVFRSETPPQQGRCSTQTAHYSHDVTHEFKDMWWLDNRDDDAWPLLAQMNTQVRWRTPDRVDHFTRWEYLPNGPLWQKGILYRYQMRLQHQAKGHPQLDTLAISQLVKLTEQ